MSRLVVVDMDPSGNITTYSFLLPNERRADVVRLTFGRARVCLVNRDDRYSYDNEW
jgi:hypothetical protein